MYLFDPNIFHFQAAKDVEALKIKAKCSEVFDQSFARFSRVGILNSCSGFRLGWETALLPLEEKMIASPDEYNTLNDLEVGNNVQKYYIEKEGLQIDYLSEDEK